MKFLSFLFVFANFAFAINLTDPKICSSCHADQHKEWSSSLHAKSHEDSNELYKSAIKLVATQSHKSNEQVLVSCGKCHNPKLSVKNVGDDAAFAAVLGIDTKDTKNITEALNAKDIKNGISCYICHNVSEIDTYTHDSQKVGYLKFNWTKENLIVGPYDLSSEPVKYHESQERGFFRQNNDLCVSCHVAQATENKLSTYFESNENPTNENCTSCHMPSAGEALIAPNIKRENMQKREIKSHFFAGARNSDIIKTALNFDATQISKDTLQLNITNLIPHKVPGGFSGRSIVFEVAFKNANGGVVAIENYELRAFYLDGMGEHTLSYAAIKLEKDTRLQPQEHRNVDISIPQDATQAVIKASYYVIAPELQGSFTTNDKSYTKPYEIGSKSLNLK